MQSCKSCDTRFNGNYCPQCGQKVIHRFNLTYLWGMFHQDVFELDRGLWRTMKDLLVRPGYMIREYLNGKTKPYFSSLKYLLVAIALFYLLVSIASMVDAGDTLSALDWKKKYFYNDHPLISLQTIRDLGGIFTDVVLVSSLSFYFLLLLPILALALKIFFKSLNFTEHLITLTFLWGQVFFVLIVLLGLLTSFLATLVGYNEVAFLTLMGVCIGAMLFYFVWTYRQLSGGSWISTLFRLVGGIYLGYFLFFTFSILIFISLKAMFA